MLKSNFIILIITFIILQVSHVVADEKFLSLKKNKVNVRYGPSFDSPVNIFTKKLTYPLCKLMKKKILGEL
jgi:SH3-like domain-containing protein